MGQRQFSFDSAAVRVAADQFDVTAETIDTTARTRLAGLAFDGAAAGQAHIAGGDALRRVLDGWPGALARWARASAEIAAALRAGAQRYTDAELLVAARIG